MTFEDKEIIENITEEISDKADLIKDWPKNGESGYPHDDYDYSTDDQNDYEYQQDLAMGQTHFGGSLVIKRSPPTLKEYRDIWVNHGRRCKICNRRLSKYNLMDKCRFCADGEEHLDGLIKIYTSY